MDKIITRFMQLLMSVFLLYSLAFSQHRGDNLAFQGLAEDNDIGVKNIAMAGTYTALAGDINSLFSNPAGLATLKNFQFTLSGNMTIKDQWENQVYRPNRLYNTMPLYLEELYIPDPANNGILDQDLALDSAYVVNEPEMGKMRTSKDAAEWSRKVTGTQFASFAMALPFKLFEQSFTIAGGYHYNSIDNYDRNDTYLDPHIGSTVYDGFTERMQSSDDDTLNVNWYRYLRSREGEMHNTKFALAYRLNDNFNFSVAANYKFGSSDDFMQLNKHGYFGLLYANTYFFSYDTLDYQIKGTSEYSQLTFDFGFQYILDKISFGLNVTTPGTLERKWEYTSTTTDSNGTVSLDSKGTDKAELPLKLNLGMAFKPASAYTFALGYGFTGYKDATFKLATNDTTHRGWANQHIIRAAMQVEVTDYLALMGGYKSVTQVFIPDGNGDKTKGPEAVSWTMGLSLNVFDYGRIDVAYEMKTLNYYDMYYSNTNYQTEKFNNLTIGYTYTF